MVITTCRRRPVTPSRWLRALPPRRPRSRMRPPGKLRPTPRSPGPRPWTPLRSPASPGSPPRGVVSYTLYAGATCSGTVLAQSSGPLSGGNVANSGSSSALAAGLYSFQATYSGDTNYTLTNASCEPFTVAKAPSAIAAAVEPAPGSQPLPLGSQATAGATITGVAGFTPTGTVTFNLYPVGDSPERPPKPAPAPSPPARPPPPPPQPCPPGPTATRPATQATATT